MNIINRVRKNKNLRTTYRFLMKYLHLPYPLWGAKIGHSTIISKKYIKLPSKDNISIGCRCNIMSGFRIETITKYAGQQYSPSIKIGDDVMINQNFHCVCAESIEIGAGTSITANCGVFDIIHPYESVSVNPRQATILTSPVSIGENSLIGMNSVILPGVHLGKHTIVGANSTVKKGDYPDYVVLVGSPARIVKRYNHETGNWVSV